MKGFKGLNTVEVDFEPIPDLEQGLPSAGFAESRIALSVIDHLIVQGGDQAPGQRPRIANVHITAAAQHQIDHVWWKHRDDQDPERPPLIALKYFVTAYRSGNPPAIEIEVHPGRDTWE